ncbi:MAG: circularly permuted type 2 ATP-grasp protein, partial [Pseudoxanthomonas sp.]
MDWAKYRTTTFDELIQADGQPRPAARRLVEYLGGLSGREIAERQLAADVIARVMGITFTVYSDGRNVDRTLPFDLIPRVIPLTEWTRTEAGLKQRMRALNLFIGDIYGRQQIVKDKVFPAMLLKDSVNFREQCVGMQPPLGVWAHICGSDLVRDGDGTLYALEDNLRIPSGVSYMLENRMVAKRVFPELFETSS